MAKIRKEIPISHFGKGLKIDRQIDGAFASKGSYQQSSEIGAVVRQHECPQVVAGWQTHRIPKVRIADGLVVFK